MAIDEGEFEGDERSGFRKALDSVFGIDARSLALFRMVIALLVLVDIYVRWPTLADFQTDDGAFSRVVNFPPRGIGARTIEQLQEAAAAGLGSLSRAAQAGAVGGRGGTALAAFLAIVEDKA